MAFKEGLELLRNRPKTFDDCIEFARLEFEKYFNHDVKQLLHVYPLDAKTKEGNLFWSLPKRPPTPEVFDPENMFHLQFLSAMACLRATIFKIKIPSQTPRSEAFRRELGKKALEFKVPEFKPDDAAAKEIQASVDKDQNKNQEQEEEK